MEKENKNHKCYFLVVILNSSILHLFMSPEEAKLNLFYLILTKLCFKANESFLKT